MKEKSFKSRPGQTDFTNIRWAPVINCVLKYKDKILLVKRSGKLKLYPGYWNGISGFLDDDKSLEEKVYEEIKEETGLKKEQIISIHLGQILELDSHTYKKTWIVHPVLVEVNTDKLLLDWEAEDHRWVRPEEARKLNLLSGFDQVLKALSL